MAKKKRTTKRTSKKQTTKKTPSPRTARKSKPSTACTAHTTKKKTSSSITDASMSILDAAVHVLKQSGKPMRCKAMIELMLSGGHWKTNGKTPHATLYSALVREIQIKGNESRFKKIERGLFALTKNT